MDVEPPLAQSPPSLRAPPTFVFQLLFSPRRDASPQIANLCGCSEVMRSQNHWIVQTQLAAPGEGGGWGGGGWGELQRTPADFLFQSKQKLPFNFKVILKDDETETALEDFLHRGSYSHSHSQICPPPRDSWGITYLITLIC